MFILADLVKKVEYKFALKFLFKRKKITLFYLPESPYLLIIASCNTARRFIKESQYVQRHVNRRANEGSQQSNAQCDYT